MPNADAENRLIFARSEAASLKLAEAILDWIQKHPPSEDDERGAYREQLAQVIARHISPIGVPALRRTIDESGKETGESDH